VTRIGTLALAYTYTHIHIRMTSEHKRGVGLGSDGREEIETSKRAAQSPKAIIEAHEARGNVVESRERITYVRVCPMRVRARVCAVCVDARRCRRERITCVRVCPVRACARVCCVC